MRDETESYIRDVLHCVHASPREQARIEADLRSHLAEAIAAGESPAGAISRLGTPQQVAEAFMASVPLHYAGFWRRVAAFTIDLIPVTAVTLAATMLAVFLANLVPRAPSGFELVIGAVLIALVLGLSAMVLSALVLYFPILEGRFGQTLGKRLLGLRVLKESGLPIGFKDAFLRRLPFYLDFWPVDALFVPFTAKRQRGFEIIARTVVVREAQ